MILIYMTCKDKAEAKKISRHLLEKKLIACANIHPIESMYWWKGKIEEAGEYAVIAKTEGEKYEKITREVKAIHSYDVPCILKIKAEADEGYGRWIRESVG